MLLWGCAEAPCPIILPGNVNHIADANKEMHVNLKIKNVFNPFVTNFFLVVTETRLLFLFSQKTLV